MSKIRSSPRLTKKLNTVTETLSHIFLARLLITVGYQNYRYVYPKNRQDHITYRPILDEKIGTSKNTRAA